MFTRDFTTHTIFIGRMDKRIRPFEDVAPLNVSINLLISSFDSIAETTMDFRSTFIMRLIWPDRRMRFPDLPAVKSLNNKTVLTMDLEFLDDMWVPGMCSKIPSAPD